jgi:hypothetical protein
MKKLFFALLMLAMGMISQVQAQDSRTLRAARAAFSSAENNYKRGNHNLASQEYEIVINTIPASADSRRNLEMRLESLIKLVDIYFYKTPNINNACDYLQLYFENMNLIRNQGTLRASDLLNYQRKEMEFARQHVPKCENYNRIDTDMDRFKKIFEEEFE